MPVDTIITRWSQQGLSKFVGDLKRVENAASGVESQIAKMERRGNALTVGGAAISGASLAARRYIKSAIELGNFADSTAQKLRDMLEVRGQGAAYGDLTALAGEMQKLTGQSDEVFKDASTHLLSFGLNAKQIRQIMPGLSGQATTMGQSLDSVADSFGRAFASGNAGALTRSGVVLSQADKDAIDYAKGISEAAGQQEIFNRVLASYNSYALKAGQGISDAARAQNYFNQVLGDAEERFGSGAANAQMNLYKKGGQLLDALNAKPQLLEMAGAWATYGSALGAVAGPMTTAIGIIYKMRAAKQLATIAQNLETNAERAKIPVALEEAAAHQAATVAVGEHALANRALAASGGGIGVGGAGKIGIGAKLLNFLKAPLALGGTSVATSSAFGGGRGVLGALGSAGAQGGARTMGLVTNGGALLSAGAGLAAGYQASGNMKAAGYSDGQSYLYGAATGIGAAAVSMFVPGGVVYVALGAAAAALANKLINEPMERAAEAGTGADNKTVMGDDMEARVKAAQVEANRTRNYRPLSDLYNEMATKANDSGDQESAVNFRAQALSYRKLSNLAARPKWGQDTSLYWEKQRAESLAWQDQNRERHQRMQDENRRMLEANGYQFDTGQITNAPGAGAARASGITATGVQQRRDGSRTIAISGTLNVPEGDGERIKRQMRYNSRTPAPSYTN